MNTMLAKWEPIEAPGLVGGFPWEPQCPRRNRSMTHGYLIPSLPSASLSWVGSPSNDIHPLETTSRSRGTRESLNDVLALLDAHDGHTGNLADSPLEVAIVCCEGLVSDIRENVKKYEWSGGGRTRDDVDAVLLDAVDNALDVDVSWWAPKGYSGGGGRTSSA